MIIVSCIILKGTNLSLLCRNIGNGLTHSLATLPCIAMHTTIVIYIRSSFPCVNKILRKEIKNYFITIMLSYYQNAWGFLYFLLCLWMWTNNKRNDLKTFSNSISGLLSNQINASRDPAQPYPSEHLTDHLILRYKIFKKKFVKNLLW